MSLNYNEGLTAEQVAFKGSLVAEIMQDYSKIKSRSPSITKVPSHSSLDEFITSVKELIDSDQINADQKVTLIDDHSKDNIFQDINNPTRELSGVVLYSLDRRSPGTMAGGNSWFSKERREVKPRIREIITNDINNPGQAKIVYSQWFDNRVRFKVCARTNKRANELCDWFENLLETNRYYFNIKGITKFFMDERMSDNQEQIGNEQVECRPFFFFVRTEKTYELTEQALNKIVISLTT